MGEEIREVGSEFAKMSERLRQAFKNELGFKNMKNYISGLLGNSERKNGWQLSEYIGERTPYALQQFIYRGKAAARTEFGAKAAISVVDGFVFVDTVSWDAYNEGGDLIEMSEYYKACYGFYPEAVMVDKIYRTRDNISY